MSRLIAATTTTAPATISRAPAAQGFNFRTWLPALIVLIGMPVLALTTTKYVLLPPMENTLTQVTSWEGASAENQFPVTVSLKKILINPSDTTRVHPIMSSLTLVVNNSAMQSKVDANRAELLKLTVADLSDKTISDMEKPGAQRAAGTQLLADFNRALGGPVLKRVYVAVWPAK
jgi:flagellar basal body-associated protein FliL